KIYNISISTKDHFSKKTSRTRKTKTQIRGRPLSWMSQLLRTLVSDDLKQRLDAEMSIFAVEDLVQDVDELEEVANYLQTSTFNINMGGGIGNMEVDEQSVTNAQGVVSAFRRAASEVGQAFGGSAKVYEEKLSAASFPVAKAMADLKHRIEKEFLEPRGKDLNTGGYFLSTTSATTSDRKSRAREAMATINRCILMATLRPDYQDDDNSNHASVKAAVDALEQKVRMLEFNSSGADVILQQARSWLSIENKVGRRTINNVLSSHKNPNPEDAPLAKGTPLLLASMDLWRDFLELLANKLADHFVFLHSRYSNEDMRSRVCDRTLTETRRIFRATTGSGSSSSARHQVPTSSEWLTVSGAAEISQKILLPRNARLLRKLASKQGRSPVLEDRARFWQFFKFVEEYNFNSPGDAAENDLQHLRSLPIIVALSQLSAGAEFISAEAVSKLLAKHYPTRVYLWAIQGGDEYQKQLDAEAALGATRSKSGRGATVQQGQGQQPSQLKEPPIVCPLSAPEYPGVDFSMHGHELQAEARLFAYKVFAFGIRSWGGAQIQRLLRPAWQFSLVGAQTMEALVGTERPPSVDPEKAWASSTGSTGSDSSTGTEGEDQDDPWKRFLEKAQLVESAVADQDTWLSALAKQAEKVLTGEVQALIYEWYAKLVNGSLIVVGGGHQGGGRVGNGGSSPGDSSEEDLLTFSAEFQHIRKNGQEHLGASMQILADELLSEEAFKQDERVFNNYATSTLEFLAKLQGRLVDHYPPQMLQMVN
ncbi:unnamed protein product, partial [Amoebophrya sp. A25]